MFLWDKNAQGFWTNFLKFGVFLSVLVIFIFMMLNAFLGYRQTPDYGSWFVIVCMLLVFVFISFPYFEEIKIGEIFQLKRKIQEVSQEKEKLEEKNTQLLNHLVTINSNNFQKQNNVSVYGLPNNLLDLLGVTQASDKEVAEEKTVKESVPTQEERSSTSERMAKRRAAEEKIIKHELLGKSGALAEARFNAVFDVLDPVMRDRAIIFDGYYKDGNDEVFIEITPKRLSAFGFTERLYFLLNKIYLYRTAKKNNSYLVLIVYDIDEISDRSDFMGSVSRFFTPSLDISLLKIKTYSKAEIESLPE